MRWYFAVILSIMLIAMVPLSVAAEETSPEIVFEDEINATPNGSDTVYRYKVFNHNSFDREYYINVLELPAGFEYTILADSYVVPGNSFIEGAVMITVPVEENVEQEYTFSVEAGWNDRLGEVIDTLTDVVSLSVIVKATYELDIYATESTVTVNTVVPPEDVQTDADFYDTLRLDNILKVKNNGNVKTFVEVSDVIASPYNDEVKYLDIDPQDVGESSDILQEVGLDGWSILGEIPEKVLPASGSPFGDTKAIPFGVVIDDPSATYDIKVTFTAEGYSYRDSIQGEKVSEDSVTITIKVIPIPIDEIDDVVSFYIEYTGDTSKPVEVQPGQETLLEFRAVNDGTVGLTVHLAWFVWKSGEIIDNAEDYRVGEGDIDELVSSVFDPAKYDPSTSEEQFFNVKDNWFSSGLFVFEGGERVPVDTLDLPYNSAPITFYLSLIPPQYATPDEVYHVQVAGATFFPIQRVYVADVGFRNAETFVEPPVDVESSVEEEINSTLMWFIIGFVAFAAVVAGVFYYVEYKQGGKGADKTLKKGK